MFSVFDFLGTSTYYWAMGKSGQRIHCIIRVGGKTSEAVSKFNDELWKTKRAADQRLSRWKDSKYKTIIENLPQIYGDSIENAFATSLPFQVVLQLLQLQRRHLSHLRNQNHFHGQKWRGCHLAVQGYLLINVCSVVK